MYNISDKSAAVREIKKYLLIISENLHPQIPRTTVDGFYDEETKAAVTEFQKIYGIDPVGTVDYETFTKIYEIYSDILFDIIEWGYVIEDGGFPLSLGDYSEDVRALHMLIGELGKTYSDLPKVGTGSYYSEKTENAANELRRIFMMPVASGVDKALFVRIKKELRARRRADQNYSDIVI